MRSLVVLFALLSCGFRLGESYSSPLSTQQSVFSSQQSNIYSKSPSRYELKFQSELDNSTIIKGQFEQQIFKCQVRLAPIYHQRNSLQYKTRLKTITTPLKSSQEAQDFSLSLSNTSNHKWQPLNVSLIVDWFKDNQLLDTNYEASLSIINVELFKGNASAIARNNNDKTTNASKSNKPRIEIKNTLNGSQSKLTSRLKLNQVRVNDSGRYKCIARASFQAPAVFAQTDESQAQNVYQSITDGLRFATGTKQTLVLIEQTLESNGGTLLVKNTTLSVGQPEETVVPEGKHNRKFKVAPSIRDSNGKRKLDSLANTEQPASLLDRASSSILQLFKPKTQATNDTRHAKTQREEVNNDNNNNTNKDSQTGNGNQNSSSNVGNFSNQLDSAYLPGSSDKENHVESESNYPYLSRETTKSSKQNQQQQQQQATLDSQFEDDEDLFKLDPDKIEFINNRQTNSASFGDDESIDFNSLGQSRTGRQSSGSSLNQENSIVPGEHSSSGILKDMDGQQNTSEKNINSSNHNLSSSMRAMINDKKQTNSGGGGGGTIINTFDLDTENLSPDYGNTDSSRSGLFMVNNYLGGSFHSTKLQIAKFVNKITPELSCYTGNGEKYRGNVSITFDRRSCLNWRFVRDINARNNLNLSNIIPIIQQTKFTFDNHNYCRNPNLDSRGPWCFVRYIDELDNGSNLQNIILISTSNKQQQTDENIQIKFIQQHCPISACSEYLWVYIVAPPLGFLLFLSCLVAILIRYVRNSYYNKSMIFRASKRRGLPRFNRLIQSQASRFAPKKFTNSSSKRKGYLDDDIFEIVDDIDWSDGQTNSLSPKSTESLRLNSSFSSSSNVTDSTSKHINGCKSINPLFNEKALVNSNLIDRKLSNQDFIASNRSVTQVGPMFATLRCQMRNQANRNKTKKSSSFIAQCDLATTTTTSASGANSKLPPYVDRTNWLANSNLNPSKRIPQPSCVSSSPSTSSSSSCDDMNSSRPNKSGQTNQASSYLISCSTTSEDIEKSSCSEAIDSSYNNGTTNSDNTNCEGPYVKGSDLPQLNASSVSICLDQPLIYEGKFSQVRLAYMKQHTETPPSSSASSLLSASSSSNALGHLGTQVAVCNLKSAALIDPATFIPSNLKLRNLNHLNILKLIGYAQINNEIGGNNSNIQFNSIQQPIACSLIYDMTQLVDLNDWLKQQNKDTLTSDEPGNDLGIRRNLTCFAKQIALAIDYLHDRNIIFKDLACRNCFLDPTKMLVKLASFNIEFVNFNSNDEKAQNLKSMIRPKYLLDYYVIDSRPSDCQLLPLSWIPLESILFNKFNKQTDIWSFGCLIYELFSLGGVAYFGYSSKQVIDAVRSNLMPPQPLLCPNGIYKLMCKCLSDIPTIRPTIKQTYEQLNLYSGQCSSFLDHHLCSLATNMLGDNRLHCNIETN